MKTRLLRLLLSNETSACYIMDQVSTYNLMEPNRPNKKSPSAT